MQADLCFFVFGDIKSFLMISVLFEESVNVVRLADEINQNVFLEKDKNLLNKLASLRSQGWGNPLYIKNEIS